MGRRFIGAGFLLLVNSTGCLWVAQRAVGVHRPRVMNASRIDHRADRFGVHTDVHANAVLGQRLWGEGTPAALVFDREHKRVVIHQRGTCSAEAYPVLRLLSSDTQEWMDDEKAVLYDEVQKGLVTSTGAPQPLAAWDTDYLVVLPWAHFTGKLSDPRDLREAMSGNTSSTFTVVYVNTDPLASWSQE